MDKFDDSEEIHRGPGPESQELVHRSMKTFNLLNMSLHFPRILENEGQGI